MLKDLFISMRPHQWYKNLVLFAGILFSFNLLAISMWFEVILAFLIFCMISGSEYLINDVIDREKDKIHPTKSNRPIASGELSIYYALTTAILLIGIGLYGAYSLNFPFFVSAVSYLLLVVLYSLFLKQYFIIDILTISSGFVIRAIAGCVAIGVIISPWLILCTFFLAFFFALGKRRYELLLMGSVANNHRKVLAGYSSGIMDQMITITTAVLIMSYSLYTFLADNRIMMITIPIVIYGIFRYLSLLYSKDPKGDPEMLFQDRGLLLTFSLWLLLVLIILSTKEIYVV
jgi:4-hydroxybenzoate polyprenyltransferase